MILRKRLDELQSAQAGTDKSFLQTDTSKYDSLFGYDRATNTVSPSSALITSANKYDSIFGLDRKAVSAPSTTPAGTAPKTSGTVGEVAKALGGSFGAGALNLIASAVGTMERQLVAGTDAEGIGITAMWDNVIKSFSPNTTAEERAKVAKDIVQFGMNLTHPESAPLRKVDTIGSVYNKEGGAVAEQGVKQAETAVRKWADVKNESGVVKFFGGIGESLPASIVTRVPVVGWFLMGNQVYRNTIEQTKAEYAAKGQTMPETLGTLKALGYSALEIGTEMLFPLFGKIGDAAVKGTLGTATQGLVGLAMEKLGIKTAKEVGKLTWKTVAKQMGKEALGEGVEEVLAGAGQAGIAALTTNPDDPYWSTWSKDGGLTSLDGLFLQFLSGAVMGGGMTGVRGTAKMLFKNTQDVVESQQNKTIDERTPEDNQEFKDALVLDMTENENGEQEFITENVTNFISKVAVNQGQTFKTDTGKLFTVPSNQAVDASKVSPSAIQDVMAIRASRKAQSTSTMPEQGSQTAVEPVAPIQTENMPTAQANVPEPVVEPEIDLAKAEVISEKTSTGTIYRVGDKVYKNATFKDGKTKTKEADVYEALTGSDVVAPGKLVNIDGKEYIETPYYDIVISVDTVPKGEREKYQQFIIDNADRINQSVMELTNTGYRYSDPLQFGYKDGKLYLMDFSNAEIPQGLDKNQLLGDNYNYLSNFYQDFGLERLSKIISRSMEIKGNMESTDYEDAKNRTDGFIFVPKALQDTIYDLKMQYGDKSPNNVYYVTNQRGVQIGDIAQTESIDGIKYVYSENPIPVAKAKDYELHVLYEGQVQRRPVASAKREAKTANTDNITAKSAETTQKQATKVKKSDYVNIEGQGIGVIENIYDDGSFNIDINGQTYHRSADDTDYTKATASEYWTDLKRQINELKAVATKSRKKASDYNKSTDGVAVARKGKIALSEDGRPMPFVENAISATHRTMITDAKKASELADALQKKLDTRKARLERELGYGIEPDASEAKALGIKVVESEQKQTTKTEKKVYTAEPIKKKESAVNKKDLLVKIANKQDVSKDVESWLKTEEGIKETEGLDSPEAIAMKIAQLKTEFDQFIEGNMSKEKLLNVNLQLLAYKSLADKLALAGKVKGHDISLYATKMLTAINETVTKKNAQKLIAKFSTYDLIHDVYSDKQALEELATRKEQANRMPGGFFADAMLLSRELEGNQKVPTKGDVLYLTEAVKEMMESVEENPTAIANAEKLVKRLSKLATKGGQFIQAFSVIKNIIPEYTALKITNAYEQTVLKTVPDEQKKKFDNVVEETTEEIKKDRKKAIKQTFDKIGSAVGDETPTQEIDDEADTDEEKKLTPEKLLAKRIESDLNRKPPKQKDALQKALSVLFAKYKETNPSAKKQTDIYSAVADIIINRTEYARIWDESKPIVEASKDITDEQKKTISAYFKMLANPVMAERVLNRLVNTALKDAKINMNEEAKRYLSGKESSVDTLMKFLKSKMPNIGDAGLAYIRKYIEPLFDSKRSDKSQALIEAYYESQKKLRARQAELKAKKEKAKANRLAFMKTPAYAAKSIAKQIEAYAKITVADKPVNEFNQKLISRLMAKANEVLKRTPSNKENIYSTVSEIVMNREKYSDVWNSVQDVLKNNPDLANRSDLAKYFATMADPITANKYISRIIRANLKDMDTSVSKLAFEFFKSGDETISDFMDILRTKMPEMDNASFNYLSKYVMDELKKIMSTTRNQEYERLVRQNNWMAGKKNMPKLSEEQDIIALITKVAYQNALDENLDEVRKAWATRLGIPVMTEDIKNTIYQAARDMANATDQKTKDKIYEEMVIKVGATIPSTLPEKLTAWLRTSMLFNPTTLIRNMVNNIIAKPSYEMTDVLQNAFIKRMKNIPSEQQISGDTYKRFNPNDEIGKSVMEMTDDDSVRRIQARFAKYSLAQLFGMEKKSFNTKWIQEIADATYGIMSIGKYKNIKIKPMGDIYMFQKYLRQSLYNKMIAQNYSNNMTAEQKASIVDNSMEYATMKAVTQTFRMKNILSSALLDLQKSVLKYGKAGEIANIGLKAITPFIITPVAITAESYKFSPLALAKNLAFDYGLAKITGKWKTKDAEYKVNTAHKISQALVGTATQFGIGMVLAAFGFLTGAPPEDKDEKAQWDAEGKKAYSIYIPGVGYIPIDWAQPVSTGVMIGAQTMQKMLDPKATVVGKIASPFTESFNVLFKSSVLQNISRQFGISYGQTPGSKVVDLAEALLFQGMPTLIRKFNAVIDPYTRDVYRGTEMQIFFNRILQSVPGGVFAIPKKIDVWGNNITAVKTGGAFGAAGRFINNFLSPFMFTPDKMDNVTKEVTRVFNETSGTMGSKALPSIASKTITRTKNKVKETWELTPEQYIEYQQDIGKQSKTAVEKLINSASYKNMSDDKKAEALASVYSKAVEDAGDKIVKKYPKTK